MVLTRLQYCFQHISGVVQEPAALERAVRRQLLHRGVRPIRGEHYPRVPRPKHSTDRLLKQNHSNQDFEMITKLLLANTSANYLKFGIEMLHRQYKYTYLPTPIYK